VCVSEELSQCVGVVFGLLEGLRLHSVAVVEPHPVSHCRLVSFDLDHSYSVVFVCHDDVKFEVSPPRNFEAREDVPAIAKTITKPFDNKSFPSI
jgi:hypothetical protein